MKTEEELSEFAIELCRNAGKILISGFRSKKTQISYKSRTDMVTNIDRESEEFIVSEIKSSYPEHSIIAEEGSRKDSEGNYTWYIDPLDATNNYAHGIPFFCISIGVYSSADKKIVSGAVYDPYHDEMFHSWNGGGAFCNGEKIHVSDTADIGIALLATGFPYAKEDMAKNNSGQFNAFLPNIQGIRRIGSAALDLCYLASGRIDGYWEPMLHPWDTAAGSLIVTEAGGLVTKYDGATFDPEFPEILASNGILHDRMIKIIHSA
ncbi:MAG TPA: inositol monophosphatase family protein [Spirochaetota bacterium]|nr:inositol monophosphatase family protein [Spirochaetota bacterium]HPJ34623.1 inositol monophosphatase family protein [Spirochaetota bacterium]